MNEILTYFTPPGLVFLQMVRTFAADTEKAILTCVLSTYQREV